MPSDPVPNVQFRGEDGRLYQIPSAVLARFAAPEGEAWPIRDTGSVYYEGEMPMYAGPDDAVVSVSPILLAHVAVWSLEDGFYDELEEALAPYAAREVVLDAQLAAALGEAMGGDVAKAGDDGLARASLVGVARVVRDAFQAGRHERLIEILGKDAEIHAIAVPVGAANAVKRVAAGRVSGGSPDSTGRRVLALMARKGGGGTPDGGTPDGGTHRPEQCVETHDTGMMGCPG